MKRIAIATRWGMAMAGPADPHLSVRDPVDEGESLDPRDKDALFVGLLRLHIANLIEPLGHANLADALRRLTQQPFPRRLQGDIARARALVDTAPVRDMEKASAMGGLVGGIVTRAGPITDAALNPADQETLSRLNLRPVFVEIERDLIRASAGWSASAQARQKKIDIMLYLQHISLHEAKQESCYGRRHNQRDKSQLPVDADASDFARHHGHLRSGTTALWGQFTPVLSARGYLKARCGEPGGNWAR